MTNANWEIYWLPERIMVFKTRRYASLLSRLDEKNWTVTFRNRMYRNGRTYDEILLGKHILVQINMRRYTVYRDGIEILDTVYKKRLIKCLNKEE